MWHKLPVPEWIDNEERMVQVCREIEDTGVCGIDTETTGLDLAKDHVLFWSLAPHLGARYTLSRRMLHIFNEEIAQNPDITWAMSNANFDNCMLANSGVPLMAGTIHCTQVMDRMHDENKRHGLKEISQRHLKLNMNEFKKVFKKRKDETYQDTLLRMMREEPDKAYDYASLDAYASLACWEFLKDKLEGETAYNGLNFWDLYTRFEAPYQLVLYENIRNGIMIDVGWLNEIRKPITAKLIEVEYEFNKLVGYVVNLQSPKQLVQLFIKELGKEPIKWTSGGQSGNKQPSVDEGVLKIWARDGDRHAKLLMEHRSLAKVLGTYVDGLSARISPDGRIHTMINQHVAVTGRLSSSEPNLQNIPRPDNDIWGLRGAFMPDTGMTLVAADYAQLEMRILAHMSGDERMRDVIRKGWDIHMGTASVMYETPYEDLQEAKFLSGWFEGEHIHRDVWPEWVKELMEQRQTSKTVGFGINYGEGDRALARKLGISLEEAQARKAKYFKPYPKVKDFIEFTHASCRETLEVNTILGAKRRLLDADADWKDPYYDYKYRKWMPERPGKLAARALRQAVNTIIQGSAGEIAKLAQMRCHNDGFLRERGAKQLLQIHDEILFEVPNEVLPECCARIKKLMEKPFADIPEMLGLGFDELSVPLGVDIGTGEAWSEAH